MSKRWEIRPDTPLSELQALARAVAEHLGPRPPGYVPARMVRSMQQSLAAEGYDIPYEVIEAAAREAFAKKQGT